MILRMIFRSLKRDMFHTFVSLLSLSVGFATAIVLGQYVQKEIAYDSSFSQSDRIFRVAGKITSSNGDEFRSASVSPLLASYLETNFPEVEETVRFDSAGGGLVEAGGVTNYWDRDTTFITDPNIFNFFSHEIIAGNAYSALLRPQTMAVSESFALLHYGRTDVVGETVTRRGDAYTVNLVFADLPENTHLKYDILLSTDRVLEATRRRAGSERLSEIWLGSENPAYTYVLLPEDYETEQFLSVSNSIWEGFLSPLLSRSGYRLEFYLEPMREIHFNSATERDFPRGNRFYPIAIASIAFVVFLISLINYVLLTTARTVKRERSLAFQKLLGASNKRLLFVLIIESTLFCVVALVIGFLHAEVASNLIFANGFLGSAVQLEQLFNPTAILVGLCSVLVLGFLSSLYPASYLSGVSASLAYLPGMRSIRHTGSVMKPLMFLQLLISIIFVSYAIFMYLQMHYVDSKPLGFQTEDRITMRVYRADNIDRLPQFISEIVQTVGVNNATVSREIPGEVSFFNQTRIEDSDFVDTQVGLYRGFIDENYLDTMEIRLKSGKNLSSNLNPGDSNALVNQRLVEVMNWDDPLQMRVQGLQVIGVLEDFHFQGLHEEVAPLYLQYHMNYIDYRSDSQREGQIRTLTINLGEGNVETRIADVRRVWDDFFPDLTFDYRFLDDAIADIYGNDRQQMHLLVILAVLCLLMSALGQYSMTTLSIEQRKKEIAIRRTFGASGKHVVNLFFKAIFALLVIAGFSATLFGYFIVDLWLDNFAYRIESSVSIFFFAVLLVAGISFLTTLLQCVRVIVENPANTLRYA